MTVNLLGCAEVFGIEATTARDAGGLDAPGDAVIDARICTGGDAHIVDESTGACYLFYLTPQARDQARATCSTQSALLASVQTGSENQLITNLIGSNTAFLGGNDEAIEGTFKWDDGSNVVLTNWNAMEPNNGGGLIEEDCIVINGSIGGKWDDRPCSVNTTTTPGSYPFVCERN